MWTTAIAVCPPKFCVGNTHSALRDGQKWFSDCHVGTAEWVSEPTTSEWVAPSLFLDLLIRLQASRLFLEHLGFCQVPCK